MKRSARLMQGAIHAALRSVLAAVLALASGAGGWVAFLDQDWLWVAAAGLGVLGFALWAAAEAVDAWRLDRLAADEREHEERRMIRPRL